MTASPLVSVVLPVYNGERLLAEAIGSVLQQAYQPLEIIIVDDGSTDTTAQVAAGFADRIHYYYQPNSGPAAARNLGIQLAKGEFIAFIDADDLWPEDKLSMQMRCFEAFPTVEIVQGLINRIKLQNQTQHRLVGVDIDFPFIYTNLGSMVMHRSVFEKVGYFDAGLKFHEDSDFWLRARELGINILVQRRLALIYRIHEHNLTTGKDMISTGFLNIIRRSILRRRKSSGIVKELGRLTTIPELLVNEQQFFQRQKQEPLSWPLVSVILFDSGNLETGQPALDSISNQDYPHIELMIVGSKLDRFNALIMDTFNQTGFIGDCSDLVSGLNAAIERSNGEFIAFLDTEGEWAPGKIKTQVAYLLSHPGDGYVVGRTRHIIMPDVKYPSELIDELSIRKRFGDLFGTLMSRRSTFLQVGGFGAGHSGMEETDWLLRAMDKGIPHKMLPDICLFRFVKPNSQIVGVEQMKSALLESIRSSVLRKRNFS